MISSNGTSIVVWAICGLAIAGVIGRPFRWPEAVWAVAGALLLLVLGSISPGSAWAAVRKGDDVYLFLIGMMLLSEAARREGLFDWAAVHAVNAARGSTARLFLLVYLVGTIVTIFLSNDATAVVLTPAVYAAARRAEAKPLPLLFACAMIANAASFVLPISNPANLVLYDGHLPPLGAWMAAFALPSLGAIIATYAALRRVERGTVVENCATAIPLPALSRGGMAALGGVGATAMLLIAVSHVGGDLGLPTCLAGIATGILTCLIGRQSPFPIMRGISWNVLPLVGGLFVLVEALSQTGLIRLLADYLHAATDASPSGAAALAGSAVAVGSNLMNNLPAGLIASGTISHAHAPRIVTDALLIGVDLGPNLSITGSLATILWLTAIRREGEDVSFWRFLKVGIVTMPPALVVAIGVRLLLG